MQPETPKTSAAVVVTPVVRHARPDVEVPAVPRHADPDRVEHVRGNEVGAVRPEDLPRERADARVFRAAGLGEQALEVVGREDDVGVEDEDPRASRLDGAGDREVVAAGVAEVLAGRHDRERHGRHLFEGRERGARAVLRRVVHRDDREVAERLREERGQKPLDVARLVVRDDRDEDGGGLPGTHAAPPFGRSAERQPRPRSPRTTRACAAAASRRGWSGRTNGRSASRRSGARERREPRDGADARGRVAREVAEEIPDVDGAEVAVGKRVHRDAAHVRGAARGNVPDPPARFQETRAEVHVLEPRGR